jgi:hypothetical protein
MRIFLASLLFTLVAACGGKSTPAPAEPEPDPAASCQLTGENNTPGTGEECECAGYTVVGDIGDGQVKCPGGTTEVSRINYGIEGGVCCTNPEGGDAAQTGGGSEGGGVAH